MLIDHQLILRNDFTRWQVSVTLLLPRLLHGLLPNDVLDVLALELAEQGARARNEELFLFRQLDCRDVCLAAHELFVETVEYRIEAPLRYRACLLAEGSGRWRSNDTRLW